MDYGMIGKIEKNPQLEMFKVPLQHFIKENHELVLLSQKIDWEQLENDLSVYYCEDNGRPGIPIRTIAGIVLLKRIFDESDESVLDRWVENPYWQYLSGMKFFEYVMPIHPSSMTRWRNRIGEAGAEELLPEAVHRHACRERVFG